MGRQDHCKAEVLAVISEAQALSQSIAAMSTWLNVLEGKLVRITGKLADRQSRQMQAFNSCPFSSGVPGDARDDMGTVFSHEDIGGENVNVSMNYIFSHVQAMERTLKDLSTRYQGSGVSFGGSSFPGPADLYMSVNPSGSGHHSFQFGPSSTPHHRHRTNGSRHSKNPPSWVSGRRKWLTSIP